MAISASQVAELRAATGAGMMDCKKALEETGGDVSAAKDYLRKKGIAVAQKKAARETNEGAVAIRVADDGKQGAMVQLACETDFVARNDEFQALLGLLAEQVLARGDAGVNDQQAVDGGGRIGDVITETVGKVGENVQLLDAVRLAVDGEGVVGGYVHSNHRIGVLVALAADGAVDRARLEELAKDLSMHIAASQVNAVSAADLDPAVVEKEKEILVAQARESGKPENIIEKMVQGRLDKFVQEVTLLDQPFVKAPDMTVKQLLDETGRALGAALSVTRFAKYQF